jgi:hypothetical protein
MISKKTNQEKMGLIRYANHAKGNTIEVENAITQKQH